MQCATHPELPAHSACSRCSAALCDACVKTITVAGRNTMNARLATCDRCGGLVQAIPGALRTTEKQDLEELLRRPFDKDTLMTIVAISVPWGLTAIPLPRVAMLGAMLYFGALATYYFQVVDHVGRGSKGLPFSSEMTSAQDLLRATIRGLIVCGIAVGPALVVALIDEHNAPLALFLLAFGLCCAPAAILSIVLTNSAWNGLWPIVWAQIIARSPRAYARLVSFYAASFLLWWIGNTTAWFFLRPIPWVGVFLSGLVNTLLTIVQALLVGSFLRRNAHRFQ
ncbi:MAG: hypothetical protein ABI193_06145 [Minicystis sp.]